MSVTRGKDRAQRSAFITLAMSIASIAVAVVLSFSFVIAIGISPDQPASSNIPAIDQSSAAASSASANLESEGGEAIEDEGNPLSSGLGGGEPVTSNVSIGGAAVVGTVAAGTLFFVLIRRLNSNIKDMDTMFR